jgi:NTE family protein
VARVDARPVTLALQGGGSLGAFSWGVLDRLLDEPAIRIGVVSGASAGAMNAAMLAQGLATEGPGEAKHLLEAFWRRVATTSGSPDVAGAGVLLPFAGMISPMADALRQAARGLSRTQVNPLGLNPLRGVLDGLLDPSVFGTERAPTLVVSATRVRTGEARLFRDAEVTADALLASACLPQLFPAVVIDGEAYWDGGYAANPPLRALVEAGAPADIVLVRTTPVERPDPPVGASGVAERVDEIAFGAALRQELRSLALAQRFLADVPDSAVGALARLRDARMHAIGAEEAFRALKGGSHHDASWSFLQEMRDLGRGAADRWLAADLASVGVRSTMDLSGYAGSGLGPIVGAVPPALS